MFKPGDKVKRIGETYSRYKHKTPLDVIEGCIYTVKECIGNCRITLVGNGSFTYNVENFELMKEEKMSECTCEKKTVPHKHAKIIKAWADGKVIQWQAGIDCWVDYNPSKGHLIGPWDNKAVCNWRIKPEPKPDVVRYLDVRRNIVGDIGTERVLGDNLKLTFDGETGKLKSAEVIA